jgi:glyoxylase-like metal-dependent hydrolase (beta-lactamase superfamily II)
VESETRDNWTQPGTYEMDPGVFRMPLPLPLDGLRAVNVYAVITDRGVVLIDGGWAIVEAEAQLTDSLRRIGVEIRDVTEVLVTHSHRDHYTLAATLRRKWGTRISIGEQERANLEEMIRRSEEPTMRHAEWLERAGAPELAAVMRKVELQFDPSTWSLPDRWIPDGTAIPLAGRGQLRALHTPGHTTGHLVFHDADRSLLFAGDHVLPHITPSIGHEQIPQPSPLRDYLTSLALVRELPDARLLPAHGPSTSSVHQRVDELLQHHDDRLDATLKAVAQGESTAYEVASRLRWTRRDRAFDDLDPMNRCLATLETMSHLEVLAERGHVTRREDTGGVVRFEV